MGFFGDTLAGEDIIIAAAVDLGNLAGKATGSVPHPTLKDANGKPAKSRMACRTLTIGLCPAGSVKQVGF